MANRHGRIRKATDGSYTPEKEIFKGCETEEDRFNRTADLIADIFVWLAEEDERMKNLEKRQVELKEQENRTQTAVYELKGGMYGEKQS
jgi:hypothetical protein